jgi:hypothetical protein
MVTGQRGMSAVTVCAQTHFTLTHYAGSQNPTRTRDPATRRPQETSTKLGSKSKVT